MQRRHQQPQPQHDIPQSPIPGRSTLLLRALTQPNHDIDFSSRLPALLTIAATSPPTSALYIMFEEDVLPGIIFRVDTEEEEVSRSEDGLEFESESGSPVGSRDGSETGSQGDVEGTEADGANRGDGDVLQTEVEGSQSGAADLETLDVAQTNDEDAVGESEDEDSNAISLHDLAHFVQRTIYAPLPPSAQDILSRHHPQLFRRPRPSSFPHSSTSSQSQPRHWRGPRHQSHRSDPFQPQASLHHPDFTGSRPPLRIIDALGNKTKFGGLAPFESTWHGHQVWIVRLLA